jgi:hypothetical protein
VSANFNIVDLLKRKQPRQPWDERTPGGQTVPELLRQPSTSPALQRAALAVPHGDVVELLKQPAAGAASPVNPAMNTGTPPPPNEGRTVNPTIPPINVGASTAGQSPIARQQTLVDLMRATPAGQKVRQHGDEIEVSPPEQSPSRVKNALVGLLLGTAQGGLPGGIAGAATGAIKPEMIQELLKQKHLAREEGQLERQAAIDDKRTDTEYRRAQIDAAKEGRRQYVERTDGVYEISREYPNGRRVSDIPSEARAKPAASRHYFERDDGVYYVDDEHPQGVKLSGVPAKPTAIDDKQQEREAKRQAAQGEFDQLVSDERNAGDEKNRAYAYLEQLKANAPKDEFSGELTDQAKADIRQATDAAQAADKLYQSFAEKKRDAQRRVRENQVSASLTATQPYAGRTMSAANLARYAKDKGLTVEEAQKDVESKGVRVQ